MKKQLLLLVNPKAGKGQIKNHLLPIIDQFIKGGYQVTVHITQNPADGELLIKAQGSQYDLLVCCGGDGTLNQTISAMLTLQSPPLLGYIPAGTTNDFATGLHLPKQMQKAAQAIIEGTVFTCDIGAFNERFFNYVAAFGSIAQVPYETPQNSKNFLGYLAYVLEAMKKFHNQKFYQLKIEYEDQVIEEEFGFGMISNSAFVGGFKNPLSKNSSMCDGVFEVILIKKPQSLADIQSMINTTLQINVRNGAILHFSTAQLKITCEEPVSWTLDGEYGGAPYTALITNLHEAIRIMVPTAELQIQQ